MGIERVKDRKQRTLGRYNTAVAAAKARSAAAMKLFGEFTNEEELIL